MAESEFRAKFVALFREDKSRLGRRQMPLVVDESLSVVVQFNCVHESLDNVTLKNKELANFIRKYDLFTQLELPEVLKVDEIMLYDLMSRVVPCVGCRRSIERFYNHLIEYIHPALDPLKVNEDGDITVTRHCLCNPKRLCSLFSKYGSRLNPFIECIPKTKKSRRCLLHSLDSQKVRPAGNWLDVWEQMSCDCQEEVVIIDKDVLLETLDTYLRKHRFCGECKNKVLRAYALLVQDADASKEKDYVASLYRGIRFCPKERHIHVHCSTDYVANLMSRAEPELRGSRREKHAKTIDVAQEEVLVCIGICLYERLHRISQRMREEEQTWQIMFYLGVECLRTNFEMSVEKKLGVSQMDLLCEEIRMAELAKQQKREHKRQKRKQRKDKLRNETMNKGCLRSPSCTCTVSASGSSLCKKLCIEPRSRSLSRSSTPRISGDLFVNGSSTHDSSEFISRESPLLDAPVVISGVSTCSCSSNESTHVHQFLTDESICGDSGYLSGTTIDSVWSGSPSSSPSSCDSSVDGVYTDSCCSHEDEYQNCHWSKRTPIIYNSVILEKCRHCISVASCDDVLNKVLPYGRSVDCSCEVMRDCVPPTLEDLLKTSSPSDEEVYIPPEELQEMRDKLRQTSQERIRFRETLRRRFQDFQKLVKFRFRPFSTFPTSVWDFHEESIHFGSTASLKTYSGDVK